MHASPERNLRLSVATGLLVVVAALLCLPARAQEQPTLRGVALVVGQSEYEHLPSLANPAGDADAIEELFDDLGFETTLVSDRDARRLSRDLDRFLEDAEDADVALVYYAGHGIEAGGENFLVPVDADLTSLEAAGEMLVPISDFLESLQQTVPLAILMLDACRDNPFPPGALVRLDAASEPLAMGAGGLGETRGATRLAPPGEEQVEHYGTVIGFAAAPGMVALDGAPGENSPYAAALLRHLDAMAGEEFSLVMRMVGEEVYLRTAGRQRPWVNDSLRRQLFFGAAPTPLAGEEGEILAERRQLLVTIAALPDMERRSVERAAAAGGVPMDALYAILKAMGEKTDLAPAEVETRLREYAALIRERRQLESSDPEVSRLSLLADEAEVAGAIATASALRERASQRALRLRDERQSLLQTLERRELETSSVLAREADTRLLNMQHQKAAMLFGQAADVAFRWDEEQASTYRIRQSEALLALGRFSGGIDHLQAAVLVAEQNVRQLRQASSSATRAKAFAALGSARLSLGKRQIGQEIIQTAIASFEESLGINSPLAPHFTGLAWLALGEAHGEMMTRTADAERNFYSALEALDKAAGLLESPGDQAAIHYARALVYLYRTDKDDRYWALSELEYRNSITDNARKNDPAGWANAMSGISFIQYRLGLKNADATQIRISYRTLEQTLELVSRNEMPYFWAAVQQGLADRLAAIAGLANDPDARIAAIARYEAALAIYQQGDMPLDLVKLKDRLGKELWQAAIDAGGDPWLLARALQHLNEGREIRKSRSDLPKCPFLFC